MYMHVLMNGFGASFLINTVITLMAIHFGANNLQVGYISSALFLSGIVLLFIPGLLAGLPIAKVHFWAWLLRGLVSLGYGLTLFLEGQAAVFVILVVYTLFCVSRTVGMPMFRAVQRILIKKTQTGYWSSRLFGAFHTTSIVSRLVNFFVLSIEKLSGLAGLILLEGLGVILNTGAALSIAKMPVTEKIERHRNEGAVKTFIQSMRPGEKRYVLLAQFCHVCLMVLMGFIVAFFKNSIIFNGQTGVANNFTVLTGVIASISGILSSFFIRPFADKVGSRPILICIGILLLISFTCWAVLPVDLPMAVYYILTFITWFFVNLSLTLNGRLLLNVIPDENKVAFTSMVSLFSGIMAFAAGVGGGAIADMNVTFFVMRHQYSLTFILAALIASAMAVFTFRIEDKGSYSLPETADLFLSLRNLRVFLGINMLDSLEDEKKRDVLLTELEHSDTIYAENEIRRRLNSPQASERRRFLRSLFFHPREDLVDMIIDEASDKNSIVREEAVFALGSYPQKKAKDYLLSIIHDAAEDDLMHSTAAKSLGRIGCDEAADFIFKRFRAVHPNPRVALHYLVAASKLDNIHFRYLGDVFNMIDPARGSRFNQQVYVMIARRLDFETQIESFYQMENHSPGHGVNELFEFVMDIKTVHNNLKRITTVFHSGDYSGLVPVVYEMLAGRNASAGPEYFLVSGLTRYINDNGINNTDDFIAVLYFTSHIVAGEVPRQPGPGE